MGNAEGGLVIAEKASNLVSSGAGPIVALVVTLLVLTLVLVLGAFLISRTPKD